MRNKLFLLAMLLFLSGSLFGQKYKDLFPRIVAADDENAFELLNAYLESELDHPNANIRLAIIYVKRYKAIDVLREQEKALALAKQARSYLTKSKILVTEREVKRNDEFYTGIFEPGLTPDFAQVANYIDTESLAAIDFVNKVPAIYQSFTNSDLRIVLLSIVSTFLSFM